MREITPRLTPELDKHCGGKPIWRVPAFPITSFRPLVEHVARLAYGNRDDLLFFRGQSRDYQSKAGGTTLYPSIYRSDALPQRELRHRFELLDNAGKILAERFGNEGIDGHRELLRKKFIQWGILQHYGVAATPLIDLTQSLRVACSFAQHNSPEITCYVYVLGLPFLTNRITVNSEHDLVTVRLLSICPPDALRPYFQEGYLAGTTDVTDEYESKTELDFRNRLIAKFAIPRAKSFWGDGFDAIPETALFPGGDRIREICDEIRNNIRDELQPGDLGEFVQLWGDIERSLIENARARTKRNVSVREAINALARFGIVDSPLAQELESLRKFRNLAVHTPRQTRAEDVRNMIERARASRVKIERTLPSRS